MFFEIFGVGSQRDNELWCYEIYFGFNLQIVVKSEWDKDFWYYFDILINKLIQERI